MHFDAKVVKSVKISNCSYITEILLKWQLKQSWNKLNIEKITVRYYKIVSADTSDY